MNVFMEEKIAFEPQEKCVAIDTKTREEYLNGFKQAMVLMDNGS